MITADFLHEVAGFVDTKVAKVVLNDSYEITNFQVKAVTDNVLTLNYIISVSDVSQVDKIDLKDAEENLISSNNVYIPITTDQLMIQAIEVKEGTN